MTYRELVKNHISKMTKEEIDSNVTIWDGVEELECCFSKAIKPQSIDQCSILLIPEQLS